MASKLRLRATTARIKSSADSVACLQQELRKNWGPKRAFSRLAYSDMLLAKPLSFPTKLLGHRTNSAGAEASGFSFGVRDFLKPVFKIAPWNSL